MSTLKIGVVGYSGQKFDELLAIAKIIGVLDRVVTDHPNATDIWLVSGLTNLGIPKFAYHEARRRGWKTSGIACAKANQYPCFDVDERKIVGEEWGDESATFLQECDILVRIGGGKQSHAEIKAFEQMGRKTYQSELEAINV